MASCDVQATLSDENIDEDSAKAEPKTIAKNGTVPQPTRIPGPVRLNESGSYIHTSTRKYTSLMKSLPTKTDMNENFSSTSTLVNVTEDSGVQLDCSVEGDNSSFELQSQASSLTATPCQQRSSETIATTGSLDELEAAERQTLRVLQRAVAEMEADVALHAEILEEQIKLELENQMNMHIEHEVQKEIEKTLLQQTVDQQKWQQQQEQLEEQGQLQSQSEGDSIQELDLDLELELELDLKSDSTSQQSDFIDLSQPIDDDQTSPSSPSPSPRAGARERKHVRVEELLEAENDIELLHKLLQVDNDQYTGEMAALAQPHEIHCLPNLNAGRDMLVNLDRFTADDEAEWHRKPVSIFHSLLQIICGNRIRKLSYPILFCGMAVGLIYYFRKN